MKQEEKDKKLWIDFVAKITIAAITAIGTVGIGIIIALSYLATHLP